MPKKNYLMSIDWLTKNKLFKIENGKKQYFTFEEVYNHYNSYRDSNNKKLIMLKLDSYRNKQKLTFHKNVNYTITFD
jgi:hypothetical protein